jgi:hypothetical protein
MNNAVMIYPFFIEFTNYINNTYWKLLYEDMAYGKFPSGTYIQNKHFCCFHKGKEFNVPLDDSDNFSIFTQIHSLLQTKMGISSEEEQIKLKDNMLKAQVQKEENSKRLIKDSTLTSFVIRSGNKYHLSDNMIRKIFSLLILGFMFKTLLVKDVSFNGNEINSIKGINFYEKKVKIKGNILDLKCNNIDLNENKTDITTISSYWPKYLHNISLFSLPN